MTKYVVPLAIFHPVLTGTLAAAYLTRGRFDPKRNAEPFDIARAYEEAAARNTAASERGAGRPILEPAALAAPEAAE